MAGGSTSPRTGREGFAVPGPLALLGAASYPLPVRRLAVSLLASFSAGVAAGRLALCSGRCDLLPRGLSPPSHRSCWAHQARAGLRPSLRLQFALSPLGRFFQREEAA